MIPNGVWLALNDFGGQRLLSPPLIANLINAPDPHDIETDPQTGFTITWKSGALVRQQYTACKNTSKHTANTLLAMHFDRRPNGQAPCSRHSKGVAKCLQYCLSFSFQQQTPTKPQARISDMLCNDFCCCLLFHDVAL